MRDTAPSPISAEANFDETAPESMLAGMDWKEQLLSDLTIRAELHAFFDFVEAQFQEAK